MVSVENTYEHFTLPGPMDKMRTKQTKPIMSGRETKAQKLAAHAIDAQHPVRLRQR